MSDLRTTQPSFLTWAISFILPLSSRLFAH